LIRGVRGRVALLTLLLTLACAQAALGDATSLYTGPGPRPGPDILYEPPATAPQLTNGAGWQAPSILISGATAYRSGEFLYQDYLYDDHGANSGMRDENDPRGQAAGTSSDLFSMPNGTYTYPTDGAYAMNAADLVEFRVKPLADATAFRITLNTIKDARLYGMTIAIGGTPGVELPMPNGANTTAPAEMFLTVHGTSAKLVHAVSGADLGTVAVKVDGERRQIEVRVPHAAWDPTGKTVRLAAGVGLWDNENDRYLIPQQDADATNPGGAGNLAAPSAFFNVAFRTGEPTPAPNDPENTASPAWWRDRAQGTALAANSIGEFSADVDFAKLASGATDDSEVPKDGPMDRILASHFETEQGLNYSKLCASTEECTGEYRGRLQPYAIYIPRKDPPPSGYGMTLLLHSLSANYNQYLTTQNQSQLGERGPGSIVITPEGRGPDGWYWDAAGADTFEVWADVASRYKLDAEFTVVSGYSMGGYGTYKLATQYPDLFAKGQPVVGPPGLGIWIPPNEPTGGEESNTNYMLPSLRNVPFLIWNAVQDELVPYAGPVEQAGTFDSLGYRYIFDSFATAEHLTLAIHDQYQPAADFLGDTKVDRNPPHVTYVVNPRMDFPGVGTVADHAYWLSGMKVRDASGDAPRGTIDVRSHGFGVGDPEPGATENGGGALAPGTLGALPFTEQSKAWGEAPQESTIDVLDIEATNVGSVTIDPARARVDCDAQLDVKSDGPLEITLAGCDRKTTVGGRFGSCDASRTPRASVSRAGSRVSRRRISLRGRAVAFRCAGGKPARGRVKRVSVSVSSRAGLKCRFLGRGGRLTAPRSCSRPVRLRARIGRVRPGKVPWSFSRRPRLRHGRYTVAVRAVDVGGKAGGRRGRFNRRTFLVR
jgi:hypothetical protein